MASLNLVTLVKIPFLCPLTFHKESHSHLGRSVTQLCPLQMFHKSGWASSGANPGGGGGGREVSA